MRKSTIWLAVAGLVLGSGLTAAAAPETDTVLMEGAVQNEDDTATLYWGTVEVEEDEGGTLELECSNGETITVEVADVKLVEGSECTLTAVTVEPNEDGVINHGSFVSAFVHSVKASGWEGGIGCLVRWIAQSDLGKDELSAELDLEAFPTTCVKGRDDSSAGPPEWVSEMKAERQALKESRTGKGKPPWAGKPGGDD
ncbi:MAG: hypothetical protein KatS3mg011_1114 [Acidimicrobiia bacterium]|nr:MAG: hypothetical protein KatS3mg011_1114 [Acidimicrobiia bacterium]